MATYKSKIPTELRERAEKKLEWCLKHFHKVFTTRAQGFEDPVMDYLKKGTSGGHASYRTHTISLNKVYLLEQPEDMVEDTIPHEFAHLATHHLFPRAKPHGREWKSVCRQLFGRELSRTHEYCAKNARVRNVTIKRYQYKCGCLGSLHSLTTQKHNTSCTFHDVHGHSPWKCKGCGEYIEYVGKTEYKR